MLHGTLVQMLWAHLRESQQWAWNDGVAHVRGGSYNESGVVQTTEAISIGLVNATCSKS